MTTEATATNPRPTAPASAPSPEATKERPNGLVSHDAPLIEDGAAWTRRENYGAFRYALARRMHAEGRTAGEIRAALRDVDARAKKVEP